MNWLTQQIILWKAPGMILDWLDSLKVLLSGSKTYILGGCMIGYAALGYVMGYSDSEHAVKMMTDGLGLVFLRAGIAKASQ